MMILQHNSMAILQFLCLNWTRAGKVIRSRIADQSIDQQDIRRYNNKAVLISVRGEDRVGNIIE